MYKRQAWWPADDIDSGFRRLASDVFAFESAELLIFFTDDFAWDQRVVIKYYPPGTTDFSTSDSDIERMDLRPDPGTLIRVTVDPASLEPGGYIGVTLRYYGNLFLIPRWVESSAQDQNKMKFLVVGNPAGAAVTSQTVMLGDAFNVNDANATAGVASISCLLYTSPSPRD